jgi:hypothetical protein
MSPACCAPASATAPATRLATTLPGAMPANTTCGAQEAHVNHRVQHTASLSLYTGLTPGTNDTALHERLPEL